MNKLLIVSVVAALSGLSGLVAAQEVGKVISSTPVLKRVTEPRSTCVADANGQQRCRTEMVTEDRNIGYKVVYEYAGKQHTVQLPFPPGATIELEVTPAVRVPSSGAPSGDPALAAEPAYAEPGYRDTAYPDPVYYSSQPYYDPGAYYYPYYPRSYASPFYPLLGVTLGHTWGVSHGRYARHVGYRVNVGHGGTRVNVSHGGNRSSGGRGGSGHRRGR